jgi:predicted adenine nucleotide alpha hydrolase (AANH) superfamily ATPase
VESESDVVVRLLGVEDVSKSPVRGKICRICINLLVNVAVPKVGDHGPSVLLIAVAASRKGQQQP